MPSAPSKLTVLLVDDNPELLAMLTDGLEDEFAVVTARDGVEGLEAFLRVRPACAVIDIKMPSIDGYQFVRALRGDPDTAGTPLIILTALDQDTSRLASLLCGADRFMTKPVVPSELIPAIYQAIATTAEDRERRYRALLDESGEW
jgi:DNA-binding response OmpR family regulator